MADEYSLPFAAAPGFASLGRYASFNNYGMPGAAIAPQPAQNLGFLTRGMSAAPAIATPTPAANWMTGAGDELPMGDTASLSQGSWLGDLGGFLKGAVGTKEAPGWGGLALGAAQGIGSAFLGMQQYGLAKQALEEGKRQFGLNYDAQKSTTNAALEDRQRARVASNAGAYQSVGAYMNQNGIK